VVEEDYRHRRVDLMSITGKQILLRGVVWAVHDQHAALLDVRESEWQFMRGVPLRAPRFFVE
jgi:hypothetical protein